MAGDGSGIHERRAERQAEETRGYVQDPGSLIELNAFVMVRRRELLRRCSCHRLIFLSRMLQGIPSLVVLDAKTGYVVTANGRDAVMQASSDESRKALLQSWLT